ncbi:biotin/lipoyl-containing protein [Thermohalobacter berrensis]|uniref:Acetyl-CoA carboxylase biotin carboxyl carrier protein subunit n=1 Tax=Thermohalobacter berrensis TaxID=99594 RepID=A0A419T8S6_9FIRM|nr:biotin/lipoyl-containing protein [Thermohalobacter berrensis]RKD33872.1 acetyl-CoA carboxylase biotin carboxyl carrier protein subunit [Thermohalobacter berrensis]
MKKYRITVNGKTYEVEVEELGKENTVSKATTTSPKKVMPQPKVEKPKTVAKPSEPKQESKPEKTETKSVPQGAETIKAPMPGTILDIKVNENDRVKEGEVLVILEAMKMENEIVAPRDGKVVSINVTKGQAVNAQDPLVSLE